MNSNQTKSSRVWIRGLASGILIAIGILHSFVGFTGGWDTLVDIARSGFWDTIHSGDGPPSRPLLMWFLISGFMLLMLGHLAFWVERSLKRPLPGMFAIELLIFALIVGVLSGGGLPAWLFAGTSIYILIIRNYKV